MSPRALNQIPRPSWQDCPSSLCTLRKTCPSMLSLSSFQGPLPSVFLSPTLVLRLDNAMSHMLGHERAPSHHHSSHSLFLNRVPLRTSNKSSHWKFVSS